MVKYAKTHTAVAEMLKVSSSSFKSQGKELKM